MTENYAIQTLFDPHEMLSVFSEYQSGCFLEGIILLVSNCGGLGIASCFFCFFCFTSPGDVTETVAPGPKTKRSRKT